MSKKIKPKKINSKSNIFERLYFAFVVCIPFVYSEQLIDPVLLPRQLYLALFQILVIGFIYINFKKKKINLNYSIFQSTLFKVFFGFVIINFISSFWSVSQSESIYVSSKIGLLFSLFYTTTLLIIQKKLRTSFILKGILISVLITIIIVSYQSLLILKTDLNFFKNVKSITGTFANKNLLSSTLFLSIPFIYITAKLGKFWKIISISTLFFLLIVIWILQSKAVVIATLISLIIFSLFVFLFSKKSTINIAFKIGIFIGFLSIITTLTLKNKDKFSRLTSSHTAYTRLDIWKSSLEMASENLIFGVGAGNWRINLPKFGLDHFESKKVRNGLTIYQRPHNDFIGVLCETGLLGLLFYITIFSIILYYLTILIKKSNGDNNDTFFILISTIIGYLLISFVDFPMERIGSQVILILIFSITKGKYINTIKSQIIKQRISLTFGILTLLVLLSFTVSISRIKSESIVKMIQLFHKQNNFLAIKRISNKSKNIFYKIDPTSTPIDWYVGVAYFNEGNIDKAKQCFENAYKEHPYNIHVINNLASSYVNLKNNDKAIELYSSALNISPRFNEARLNLSAVYFNSGEVEKALDIINLYDPQFENPKYATFFPAIQKGNIKLYKSKKGEERKRIMNKVFNLNQEIVAKPEFIDSYGWSITLKYKPSNFLVDIYYQHENGKWINYQKNRESKYKYLNIHGNKKYKNTYRNLPPGKYNIRIKFKNDYAESDYLTTSAVIPDYING